MKQILGIILLSLTLLLPTSCTHNNGDIGDWFGTWHVVNININDDVDPDYDGCMVWKFQNDIIEMVIVNDLLHTRTESFGTWQASESLLTLNFSHSDDKYTAGTGIYAPPSASHLPSGISTLSIIQLSSSEIVLQYTNDTDKFTYHLKRQG